MDGMISSCHYSKLQHKPGEFRVLQVNCNTINRDETLRCSFRVFDVHSEHEPYYAISYCWGKPPKSMHKIIVDGIDIPIWPAHLLMLKGIIRFLHDKNILEPYIWVDAVCINQDDNDEECKREKHSQIKLINRIYGGADSVLIWLGHEQPETAIAMTVMQWLGRRVLSAEVFDSRFPIPSLEELEVSCKRNLQLESHDLDLLYGMTQGEVNPQDTMSYNDRIWNAWQTIASNKWFARVWTLQELLLARSAIFICGEMRVSWQCLQLMVKKLAFQKIEIGVDLERLGRFLDQYMNVWGLMDHKEQADKMVEAYGDLRFSLSFIMLKAAQRGLEAEKYQDHIYGMLGLVRSEVRDGIPVDYNLSSQSVFMKALKVSCFNRFDKAFSSTRYIANLWEHAAYGPPDADCPSWLPSDTYGTIS